MYSRIYICMYIYRERESIYWDSAAEISSPAAECAMTAPPKGDDSVTVGFAPQVDEGLIVVIPNWLVKKPWLIVI